MVGMCGGGIEISNNLNKAICNSVSAKFLTLIINYLLLELFVGFGQVYYIRRRFISE